MDLEFSKIADRDIPSIWEIENLTGLSFWGLESYKILIASEEHVYTRVARTTEEGKKINLGFVIARFADSEAEVMKIAVHPKYQKMGVGGELLRLVLKEAKSRLCDYCYLEVRKSNLSAIQFYQDHKFAFFAYRKNYYSNPIEDACVMRRQIK